VSDCLRYRDPEYLIPVAWAKTCDRAGAKDEAQQEGMI